MKGREKVHILGERREQVHTLGEIGDYWDADLSLFERGSTDVGS